jgi:hypothetical protein
VTTQATFLRNEIVQLIERTGAELPASVEALDENGAIKAMVIDSDANCFRMTVKQI